MNENQDIQSTRELHAAFSEGRFDRCLELAAPDINVVFQAAGQTMRGREGFMQFMQGLRSAFPDIRIEHTNIFGVAGRVAVEFTWSGTHTGFLVSPAGTLPPSGRSIVDAKACEVMLWNQGRLTHLVNYQDFGSVLRQLGVG